MPCLALRKQGEFSFGWLQRGYLPIRGFPEVRDIYLRCFLCTGSDLSVRFQSFFLTVLSAVRHREPARAAGFFFARFFIEPSPKIPVRELEFSLLLGP